MSPDVILLKRAVLAYRSGDKQTARELLTEAAEHNPNNELVWLWRASAARTRSEAHEAVQHVLDLNPSNEKALEWIKKLRPDDAPRPDREPAAPEHETAEPAHSAARNGTVAEPEQEAAEQPRPAAEAAAEAEAPEAEAQPEAAAQDEESAGVAETLADEQEQALHERETPGATEIGVDEQAETPEAQAERAESGEPGSEPPSDADARLAALEAYLQRDDGDEQEDQTAETSSPRQVEGYGWDAERAPGQDSPSDTEDIWAELTQSETGSHDSDDAQDSDEDPLLGLLDARERATLDARGNGDARENGYQESIDGDAESDPAKDREYHDRLAELKSSPSHDTEDVWASLGMAGMDAPEHGAKPAEARGLDEPVPEQTEAAETDLAQSATAESSEHEQDTAPPAKSRDEEADQGCFICEKLAEEQDGVCSSCRSIVALRLHELAPRHEGADRATLNAALDRLRAKLERNPTAELYVKAAVTSLNLRQSNQALGYLREACRLRPHDRELLNHHDEIEKRPLVLAVDDSKTVQKMISTVLEKELYRVSQAEDGLAALAKLDEEMPTLVLLDITMPRMDGYQVCKVITGNEHTKHIPVIMLSGKDGFFDKVKGKMAGASNYITKPFDPNDLIKTVGKFAKKKES